ncbi:MAG: 2-aminoethylphosphonate--pyruvate transaminase [Fibromonadales bacterium]|nr:2-aminoethylphosphonate--pyruvate transaminase [Fibromonadales bacterium]
MYEFIPDNPYLLLTPGPLSTSKSVRNALLRDWCTWDSDYNEDIVQNIRRRLIALASKKSEDYTVVLMQGSGSFSVEAALGTVVPQNGKLLIITNGAYGDRIAKMAKVLKLNHTVYSCLETEAPKAEVLSKIFSENPDITHTALVHCETTTGMLNPLPEIAKVIREHGSIFILDAMSSFGGMPLDMADYDIDFLISSSNKCIQGVPGFAFVIAKKEELQKCKGNARSLCLDLYDQWVEMDKSGKWRYTSPTHIVRAFYQALDELEAEGGVAARYERYCENQRTLVNGMEKIGFKALLPKELQSPIITSFLYPNPDFNFGNFYKTIKKQGFVLYPGKISQADTFRIGNIGDVYPEDITKLLEIISIS